MKSIRYTILVALAFILTRAALAQGTLYLASDAKFGPDSITIDTSTGLGWLNLGEAAGLTYQQVLADTQPGGRFNGFRFATAAEVAHLYSSAGIAGAGNFPLSSAPIGSLLSLIGTTGKINGQPGIIALSATSDFGLYVAPAIYVAGFNGVNKYFVSNASGSGSTSYNTNYSFPSLGSWLVTSVPEPTDTSLLMLALGIWGGFAFTIRNRKPSNAANP